MYSGRLIVPNVCFAPKASTAVMIPPNLRTKATTAGLVTLSSMILPARDRVIDFGKYKGRMLGTLPSSYLKWVSKNLRARDYEDWAKRADEVLTDPVYTDRIEWEFAEKVLNGDVSSFSSSSRSDDQVAELLGVSERFGWNNEDKVGWSKIDFGLLGTSKGGRIPRLGGVAEREASERKKREKIGGGGGGGQGEERRRERRERLRLMKSTTATASSSSPITRNGKSAIMSLGNHHGLEDDDNVGSETRNYEEKNNNRSTCNEEVRTAATTGTRRSSSPFPGRRALVKKVLLNGRLGRKGG